MSDKREVEEETVEAKVQEESTAEENTVSLSTSTPACSAVEMPYGLSKDASGPGESSKPGRNASGSKETFVKPALTSSPVPS